MPINLIAMDPSAVIIRENPNIFKEAGTVRAIKLLLFSEIGLTVETIKTLLEHVEQSEVKIKSRRLAQKFRDNQETLARLGLAIEIETEEQITTTIKVHRQPAEKQAQLDQTQTVKISRSTIAEALKEEAAPSKKIETAPPTTQQPAQAKQSPQKQAPLSEPIMKPAPPAQSMANVAQSLPIEVEEMPMPRPLPHKLAKRSISAAVKAKLLGEERSLLAGVLLLAIIISIGGAKITAFMDVASEQKRLNEHLLSILPYQDGRITSSSNPLAINGIGMFQGESNNGGAHSTIKAITNGATPLTIVITLSEPVQDNGYVQRLHANDFKFKVAPDGSFIAKGSCKATIVEDTAGEEEIDLQAELTGTINLTNSTITATLTAFTKGSPTDPKIKRLVSVDTYGKWMVKIVASLTATLQSAPIAPIKGNSQQAV